MHKEIHLSFVQSPEGFKDVLLDGELLELAFCYLKWSLKVYCLFFTGSFQACSRKDADELL